MAIYLSLHWIHSDVDPKHKVIQTSYLKHSVPDTWHIGTDPDANPDPRIRTSD